MTKAKPKTTTNRKPREKTGLTWTDPTPQDVKVPAAMPPIEEAEPPEGFAPHDEVRWINVKVPVFEGEINVRNKPLGITFRAQTRDASEYLFRIYIALRKMNVEIAPLRPVDSNQKAMSWLFQQIGDTFNAPEGENS